MPLRRLMPILSVLVASTALAANAADAQGEQSALRDAWDCAEGERPLSMKPTERDAQLTIADRIRLQVKQLGLLCPEVLLKQDSTFSLSPEYEVYWQRFTRSTASLQFWHILYIRAWEHEPGMFDIVVISATRTTMKTAKEPLLHVDDSPTILNWGRNYRADRLADFASSTVDKLLATFRIGK